MVEHRGGAEPAPLARTGIRGILFVDLNHWDRPGAGVRRCSDSPGYWVNIIP